MNSVISDSARRLLIASHVRGMGKTRLWELASDPLFMRLDDSMLGDISPSLVDFGPGGEVYEKALSRAERDIAAADAAGVRIVGYFDSDYPLMFRRSRGAPALFWFKGDTSILRLPMITVIGTREPTECGRVSADLIATGLAERGVAICSGLALGVDSIAHQACVDSDRPTVAVMAGGLDDISPKRNKGLAAEILRAGGGLLSEFPIGVPATPANFVIRDFTQAAISACVVLIQSDLAGGSMHASRAITRLKRNLYVMKPWGADVRECRPKVAANMRLLELQLDGMAFPAGAAEFIKPLSSKSDYDAIVDSVKLQYSRR